MNMVDAKFFVVPKDVLCEGYETLSQAQQAVGKGMRIVAALSDLGRVVADLSIIAQEKGSTLQDIISLSEGGHKYVDKSYDLDNIPPEALKLVPYEVADRHCLLPVESDRSKGLLSIVIGKDTENVIPLTQKIDDVSFLSGYHIHYSFAPASEVEAAINKHYAADKARLAETEEFYIG